MLMEKKQTKLKKICRPGADLLSRQIYQSKCPQYVEYVWETSTDWDSVSCAKTCTSWTVQWRCRVEELWCPMHSIHHHHDKPSTSTSTQLSTDQHTTTKYLSIKLFAKFNIYNNDAIPLMVGSTLQKLAIPPMVPWPN